MIHQGYISIIKYQLGSTHFPFKQESVFRDRIEAICRTPMILSLLHGEKMMNAKLVIHKF